jgi:glycosyltransferase involved in cell wall biosynthesis
MATIVVFSHLRWDFVFQRPQHLLSRLAQHYPVLFVEEPEYDDGAPFMQRTSPVPNVTVCRAHTNIHANGFHDEQLRLLQPMVAQLAPPGEDVIAWFYTPMALPLLQALQPALVVYDCMDELASFKNPPKQLLQRESALLSIADLVFAGGPSLYEAKKHRHPNVHCFPSSVDVGHFQQALDRARAHPQQEAIPHPRLGFYGVLDERFDPELVGEVADAHPEWQIVLAGPVIKIDPERLPKRANIHYLGQQSYDRLPDLLAGWDVCLMPFAINEATRFISPTKVLEYMAAQLPIVSTPIADVVNPYGHVVAIAHDAQAFAAACEAALAMTPEQRAHMAGAMQAIVAATSWHNTATNMRGLIDTAPPHADRRATPRRGEAPAEPLDAGRASKVNPLRAHEPHVGTIVIGAGLAGQAAAYHLGADTLLLDRKDALDGQLLALEDPAAPKTVEARPHARGKTELNADVVQVLPREHIVALRDGRRFRYDDLVATMPLPELIKTIGKEAPPELRQARDADACRRCLKQFDIVLAGLVATPTGDDTDQALQAGKLGAQAVLANKRGRAQKAGAE